MNAEVKPQGLQAEVRGGLVAYLQVNGATKASDFYQRAFGATEAARHPVDEGCTVWRAARSVRRAVVDESAH